MSCSFVFQIDDILTLDLESDSSLFLMNALVELDCEVYYCYPASLSYSSVSGVSACLYKYNGVVSSNVSSVRRNLDDFSCILPRQNPPFDMSYITNAYLLLFLKKAKVVNSAKVLRDFPEKLLPIYGIKDTVPETLISAEIGDILEFARRHKSIIIKPLHGFGGDSVFLFEDGDVNISSVVQLLKSSLSYSNQPIIAQEYLPEVKTSGDKRVLIAGGKVVGCLLRKAIAGKVSSNMAAGGVAIVHELSESELKVVEKVIDYLQANDIFFAGIDMIGLKITEVNITSPTGYKMFSDLSGNVNLASEIAKQLIAIL